VPTTFWGKLRRTEGAPVEYEWHPLADHCADVAAVTEALLGLPVWQRRLARLAGRELTATDRARLCVLAALHDIGKLNLGFQAKGRSDLGATAGHVEEALAAVVREHVLPSLTGLSGWGEGVGSLLLSALCHHGRPHMIQSAASKYQASWWKARSGLDPSAGCEQLVARCRHWFPEAFADGVPLPDSAAFSHAFAGVVMLADWVGSDTRFFRFSEPEEDRMPVARAKALQAIGALALDVPRDVRVDEAHRSPFARVAPEGYSPRPSQKAILTLSKDESGTVTVLEAETGSGKTEAALARFIQLFEAGLVDGLYFALPTRSAATQLHARVLASARRAFATPPAVVLAVPGYLRVDDVEGQRLPAFEVLWPDHDRLRYRCWAAENSKRFLAGCIVIGTIDQVLLSTLMVGHAHLRASALLRHLLVVDEVHASDAYMQRLLQDVLGRHLTAGGHALLLSATLGSEARERLLRPGAHLGGSRLEDAIDAPYPLLTHRSGAIHTVPLAVDGGSRTVRLTPEPWLEIAERVAGRALAAAIDGAKVLVIRNTVADCIAAQQQVEKLAAECGRLDLLFSCSGVPAPHHARFARPDRESLDKVLDARLGKERPDGGCVVVATQTVQQSLDLDADFLVTDLCPADVLLQRIGRLHRHPRARPVPYQSPTAVVVVPAKRDLATLIGDAGTARIYHGFGGVYPDLRIIEATWRLIEEHPDWRIPEMNRLLVERSLHSTVLETIVQAGGPRWRAHAIQITGAVLGQARQAQLNLVDWTRPYAESSFPDAADQRIQTRLGQGDRLVHFAPAVRGPFGNSIAELVLPAWLANGVAAELDAAARVTERDGTVHFEFGPRSFVYDRLGMRPLSKG
jgi:CRISPR-associated endonuclease/helicase Cas3